jgi:hypothetical protein
MTSHMRRDPCEQFFNAAVAAIVAIALYFALVWGYDGLRILTSPSYGLEDVWRFVFAIGRLFSLGPIGLIKLAAFFGALKIAVACICVIHIVDRFRCMMRGQPIPKSLKPVSFWQWQSASLRSGRNSGRIHLISCANTRCSF